MKRAKREARPPHKRNGRPPHIPTDQLRGLVKWLRIAGYREDKVAEAMGLDAKTLRKHYRDELDNAKAQTDAMVTNGLVLNAIGGPKGAWEKVNITAAIFYAKTQMGWKETTAFEHAGKDGAPIKIESLTDAQLEILISRISNGSS